MIELERHIEILLLDNDCVIVPGLGGFMAHHSEARFDDRDNTFLPPLRTLGFNPKLNMNDSLLAQSYVEAYDISYPEAMGRIEAEVDELKLQLESEGFYELNDIGVLSINEEGNMEFEPCESGILSPDLYGLAGVSIFRIDSANTDTKQNVEKLDFAVKSIPSNPIVSSDVATVVGTDEDDVKSGERTIVIKLSVLRNAIALACAVVAFFLIATPITTDMSKAGMQQSGVDYSLLYNLVPSDGMMPTGPSNFVKRDVEQLHSRDAAAQDASRDAAAQDVSRDAAAQDVSRDIAAQKPSTEVSKEVAASEGMANHEKLANAKTEPQNIKEEKTEIRIKTAQSTDSYSIVLACRITKTNAERFVVDLHKQGLSDAHIIGNAGSSLKVVYGKYASESDAQSSLRKLRRSNELFSESWVFHVK